MRLVGLSLEPRPLLARLHISDKQPKVAEIREITPRDRSKAIVAKGSGQVSEVLHASSEKKRSLGVLMRMRETL